MVSIREGEIANCLKRHNAQCCIFPLSGKGIHFEKGPMTNAMSDLRRKLGVGSDGEPLFPKGRENGHIYRLSPRVVTDWERFVDLVRTAESLPDEEAIPVLDEALA